MTSSLMGQETNSLYKWQNTAKTRLPENVENLFVNLDLNRLSRVKNIEASVINKCTANEEACERARDTTK